VYDKLLKPRQSFRITLYTVWEKRGVSSYYSKRYTCLPLSITRYVPRTQFFDCRQPLEQNRVPNPVLKGAIHSQLNWAILLFDVIPDGERNWVNCAVLTGNSAGLRTVLSSRLSHTELRNSLRESHSFLSLPTDTTMASSQGTSVSSNSFSRWPSHSFSNTTSYCTFYAFSFLLFG